MCRSNALAERIALLLEKRTELEAEARLSEEPSTSQDAGPGLSALPLPGNESGEDDLIPAARPARPAARSGLICVALLLQQCRKRHVPAASLCMHGAAQATQLSALRGRVTAHIPGPSGCQTSTPCSQMCEPAILKLLRQPWLFTLCDIAFARGTARL